MFRITTTVLRSMLPGGNKLDLSASMLENHNNRVILNSWHLGSPVFKDTTVNLYDPVTVAVAEVPGGYLVKPKAPHYKSQFEVFFGFDGGNLGFNKQRCVFIPNMCYR